MTRAQTPKIYIGFITIGDYEYAQDIAVKTFDNEQQAKEWVESIRLSTGSAAYDWRVKDSVERSFHPELEELKNQFWDHKNNQWLRGANDPLTVKAYNEYLDLVSKKAQEEKRNMKKVLTEALKDVDIRDKVGCDVDDITDLYITGASYQSVSK